MEIDREKVREKEKKEIDEVTEKEEERDRLVARTKAITNLKMFELKQEEREKVKRAQQSEKEDLRIFNMKQLELERVSTYISATYKLCVTYVLRLMSSWIYIQ